MPTPTVATSDRLFSHSLVQIHHGNVFEVLPHLPAKSVNCCVTSPPYWGLRDYKTGLWSGGDPSCNHEKDCQRRYDDRKASTLDGGVADIAAAERALNSFRDWCGKCGARRVDDQLGAEPSPDCGTQGQAQCGRCYVCNCVRWCREVRRVLRDDGVFWLNIGDTYASGPGNRNGQSGSTLASSRTTAANLRDAGSLVSPVTNLPSGNLVGVPWRVALALQADGWMLRSECPWLKRNPMPESVDNRPSKSLEYVFMLTKGGGYFFDMEAVRKASRSVYRSSDFLPNSDKDAKETTKRTAATGASRNGRSDDPVSNGRNFRNSDLWFESVDSPHGICGVEDDLVGLDVTINGFKGAHFATFPESLVAPLVKASTSERGCCVACGAQWRRVVERDRQATRPGNKTKVVDDGQRVANAVSGNRDPQRHVTQTRTLGWEPTCQCLSAGITPCTVLDPFTGSGTTAVVCHLLNRKFVGVELSEEYFEIAKRRIGTRLGAPEYCAVPVVSIEDDLFQEP